MPWCSLAHWEQTKEAFEVELTLDVRGAPEWGRRFYLVKWLGFNGDPKEESIWEPAESLVEVAVGAIDDFWVAHPELDRCTVSFIRQTARFTNGARAKFNLVMDLVYFGWLIRRCAHKTWRSMFPHTCVHERIHVRTQILDLFKCYLLRP
jgi:hypothetical protein